MASTFEEKLDTYANLIVSVALNVQPGQRLLIGGPLFGEYGTPFEAAPLVRRIAARAYAAGARLVDVIWRDDQLQLIRLQHAPADSLEEYSAWRTAAGLEHAERGDAMLVIYVHDPHLLAAGDPQRVGTVQQTAFAQNQQLLQLAGQGAMNWVFVSAPTPGWASALFPDDSPDAAMERLWDLIFDVCRVKEPDPVGAWREHIRQLDERSRHLTQKQYRTLRYTAPGTSLTVGLPAGHIWRSGHLATRSNISFVPNMPTEEVFTMPHRDMVDGVVTATKPISHGGMTIDGVSLTFRHGRVVEATASRGETELQALLDTDEDARRLGEVALVPHSSSVSRSGLLFYNILFDENASNHLALGNAYRFSLAGGEEMSEEEWTRAGGTQSLLHLDFMIGSGKMNVDGITHDGRTEPLTRAGEWAFEV